MQYFQNPKRKNKPTKQTITAMFEMYRELSHTPKNMRTGEATEPRNNDLFNNNNLIQKTMTNENTTTKEWSEVNEAPLTPILKFENIGDTFTGKILATHNLKFEDEIKPSFKVVDGLNDEFILPTNVQLIRKISNLVNITGGLDKPIEVKITFTGVAKIEGSPNKAKQFKVQGRV